MSAIQNHDPTQYMETNQGTRNCHSSYHHILCWPSCDCSLNGLTITLHKNPAVNINDINNQNTKSATKPTFIYLSMTLFFISTHERHSMYSINNGFIDKHSIFQNVLPWIEIKNKLKWVPHSACTAVSTRITWDMFLHKGKT
jgi:hypothetical protein